MSEPTLYEAMYILDPSLPDDEVAELIEALETAVREAGGEVVGTRDFRTRRLAYKINGHTHGSYKLLYFRGGGDVVDTLRSEMAIRQSIIRSRIFVANPLAIVGGAQEEEGEELPAVEAAEETDEEMVEPTVDEAAETSEVEAADVAEDEETPEDGG